VEHNNRPSISVVVQILTIVIIIRWVLIVAGLISIEITIIVTHIISIIRVVGTLTNNSLEKNMKMNNSITILINKDSVNHQELL